MSAQESINELTKQISALSATVQSQHDEELRRLNSIEKILNGNGQPGLITRLNIIETKQVECRKARQALDELKNREDNKTETNKTHWRTNVQWAAGWAIGIYIAVKETLELIL